MAVAAVTSRAKTRRITTYRETSLTVGDTGQLRHLPAVNDPTFAVTQEIFADESARNDRFLQLAPWKGAKQNTFGFKAALYKAFAVAYGDFFESALGGKRANVALSGTGGYTTSSFTYAGGAPDNWVIVNYNTGRKAFRPISRTNGGTAFFAYQLDTAAGITSIQNAKDFGATTGACYFEDPTAGFLSFTAEIDQAGEAGQQPFTLKGAVPFNLIWSLGFGNRRMAEFSFQGTTFAAGVANIQRAARPVKSVAPFQCECYILSDFDAPGATPAKTTIVSYKLNLAPKWFPVLGTQQRSGANNDVLPDSPVQEWRREDPLGDGTLEIITSFTSSAWQTGFDAGTVYHVGLVDPIGDPGAAAFPGDATCLYLPKAIQVQPPQEVNNGGSIGQRLLFHIVDERDSGTSAGQMSTDVLTKAAWANFVS